MKNNIKNILLGKNTNGFLFNKNKKSFSHGPYNPTNYKHKLVGTKRMT